MKTLKTPSLFRFRVFLGEKRMLYVNDGINETEKTQESVSDEESINILLDQRRFEQLYGWCDQLENWLEQRHLFSERFGTDDMLAYAESDRAKWQVGELRVLEGRLRTIGDEELVQNFLKGYDSFSDNEGREDFLKTVNGYVSKLTKD